MILYFLIPGLLLLPVAYGAVRRDSYHAPATAIALVTARIAGVFLTLALLVYWQQPRISTDPTSRRAVLLVDGALSSNPGNLRVVVEKMLNGFTRAGYETLVLFFGGPTQESNSWSLPGNRTEHYDRIEGALVRMRWEESRNRGLPAALVSERYPPQLEETPWSALELPWIRPAPQRDPSLPVPDLPRSVFAGQHFSGSFPPSGEISPEKLEIALDSNPEAIPLTKHGESPSRWSFQLTINEPGDHTLKFIQKREDGSATEGHFPIHVMERPRILYVSPRGASTPMARDLYDAGFSVEAGTPAFLEDPASWSRWGLKKGDLLVLDSIPQANLTREAVDLVQEAVRNKGVDLLMVAGENMDRSVAGSTMEDLLPVRLGNLDKDPQESSLALVAIVDTSLSMFYKIGGGGGWSHSAEGAGGWGMKIKMAKKALLNLSAALPEDSPFGVLTVTSSPSWVIEPDRPRDIDGEEALISRIKAYGPGINLYSALLEAFKKLQRLDTETRHILVFLDTADVDEYQVNEVGTVWDLLDEMREEGVTLSLIGFGKTGDEHIPQLNRMAEESGGYFYLTTDINEIPGFSLQDLDLISDNLISFQQREVFHFTQDFPGLENLPPVRGQAVTTLKPGASLLAWTERGFPLLARWRLGSGSVTVFTADSGLSLAPDWFGKRSPWETVLSRLGQRTEEAPHYYWMARENTPVLLLKDAALNRGDASARVLLPNGEAVELETSEILPGTFALDLGREGVPMEPASVEISWSGEGSSGRDWVLGLDPFQKEEKISGVPTTEMVLQPITAPRQAKATDPSLLRLLILLVALLVTVDELFRPPVVPDS